jgi:hypothetical protein
VPYDDAWVPRASGLIAGLRSALGPTALRIEHIGSTAIPGMAAKDVIDLQVSVEDLDAAQRQFDAPLRTEGFRRLPYDRDHVSAGVDDQPARWAKRFGHVEGARTATSTCMSASRAHRMSGSRCCSAIGYARIPPRSPRMRHSSSRWAQAVTDVDAYTEIKDPVVDLVMTVAEPWARETGWTP